jgi:hypothetical protein
MRFPAFLCIPNNHAQEKTGYRPASCRSLSHASLLQCGTRYASDCRRAPNDQGAHVYVVRAS